MRRQARFSHRLDRHHHRLLALDGDQQNDIKRILPIPRFRSSATW
jgi:hypothetical protein